MDSEHSAELYVPLLGNTHTSLQEGTNVSFWDHKGDQAQRLHAEKDLLIVSPEQGWRNLWKPIGDSRKFYSSRCDSFGKAFDLRTSTSGNLAAFLLSVEKGMRPGAAYASSREIEKLLKVRHEKDPKRFAWRRTAADAFNRLNSILGPASLIKDGPDIDEKFSFIVHRFQNVTGKLQQYLIGSEISDFMTAATLHGLSSDIPRRVFVFDEGREIFSKTMIATNQAFMSWQERATIEIRSLFGAIWCGFQHLIGVDVSVLSNFSTIISHGSYGEDLDQQARLLNLPESKVRLLLNMPRQKAFVRTHETSEAVKVSIPDVYVGPPISISAMERQQKPARDWLEERIIRYEDPDDMEAINLEEELGGCSESGRPAVTFEQSLPDEEVEDEVIEAEWVDKTFLLPKHPILEDYQEPGSYEQFFSELYILLRGIDANPGLGIVEVYELVSLNERVGNRVSHRASGDGYIRLLDPVRTGRPGRPKRHQTTVLTIFNAFLLSL